MLGLLLAAALLGIYAAAIVAVLRVPFRAFGVLVAGMAVHNFLLMILLKEGTPSLITRALQAWKEGILILLGALLVQLAWRRWRRREPLHLEPMDWVAAAFALILIIYLVIPASLLHSDAGYARRVVEFRQLFLIPLLYLYGRAFMPARLRDLRWSLALILGSAGLVGLFGIIELWLVPTTTWLSWGVKGLSDWLHYSYNGPQGLPENFFQTTSSGLLLRRMVSLYVSPLGVAYTGLLLVPAAVVLLFSRRSRLPGWFRGTTTALLISAILFSVTRLAIGLLVIEMVLLLFLLRRRWLVVGVPVVAALALIVLFQYVRFGPLLTRDLQPVGVRPTHNSVLSIQGSTSDPSITGHVKALRSDIGFAFQRPLGLGLGNAIHQYGTAAGRGESAIFDVFDDAGVLSGLLYLSLFGMALYQGFSAWRAARGEALPSVLPLVTLVGGLVLLPIALTSDVNGDFSVTFLFWWAAGFSLTARTRMQSLLEEEAQPPPAASLAG